MSAAVTASMRIAGWNVHFTIGSDSYPCAFAGIYQNPRKPTITFADVCSELALCFEFETTFDGKRSNTSSANNNEDDGQQDGGCGGGDEDNTDGIMNIAFALAEKPDVTNEADPVEYPPWITEGNLDEIVPGVLSIDPRQRRTVTYHIVQHSRCRLPTGSSLKDHLREKCAKHLLTPNRRRHPAYLPHSKTSSDLRLNVMPMRRTLKARSQSPSKRTVSSGTSGATSPGKPTDEADGEYDDMVAPATMNIDITEAKRVMSEFRMACLNQATCCAVSGDGEPWCPGQPLGPGIQACHIIPQRHYHLYPVTNTTIEAFASSSHQAIQASPRRLREAWQNTWSPHNGILLMKHIHEFFDTRLLSIHPQTLLIRVFVPYQALERYHGTKAKVASIVDRNALRHHYDMCCIENMAADRPNLDIASSPVTSRMSTSGGLAGTSGDGSTPFSEGTDLPLTPAQVAVRPAGDPSKRQRSTRGDDHGQGERPGAEVCDEEEEEEEEEAFRCGKRRRIENEHTLDGYITPYNSREFLADVNWELCKFQHMLVLNDMAT